MDTLFPLCRFNYLSHSQGIFLNCAISFGLFNGARWSHCVTLCYTVSPPWTWGKIAVDLNSVTGSLLGAGLLVLSIFCSKGEG